MFFPKTNRNMFLELHCKESLSSLLCVEDTLHTNSAFMSKQTPILDSDHMTSYTLQNGIIVDIVPFEVTHATSLSNYLFQGVSIETIIQQRNELLAPGPEEVYSICAVLNSKVVGVCTGVRRRWLGARHRIELVQVVVHDEFRGLGLAGHMMRDIALHFRALGVEILEISVASDNCDAFLAYFKIGFKQVGILRDGLKYDGQYTDEILLWIPIADLLKE